MRNTYALTEAAIQLAIFIVLFLASLYVPLLGMMISLFLSLPFIVFTMRHGYRPALVLLTAAVIVSTLISSVLSAFAAVMFGTGGIVIGALLAKQKNRYVVLAVATIAFLVNIVINYVVSVKFFDLDIIAQTISVISDSFHTAVQVMESAGKKPPEATIARFEQGLKVIKYVTPTLFVITALAFAYLTIIVSVPILKRLKLSVGTWPPFRQLMLPRQLVWYYLLVLIATFFPLEQGTFAFIVVINLYYVLQLLFAIQGFSFLYYIAYRKQIAKGIVVAGTIVCLFIPFLLYLIAILGIIDLGFELRKRVQ
ncbi:uncharacterized protein YybS (DUF2232 family) [Anoxybacillus voinovskiensis]|uniref:Uncharacterized protein YybS (DUF2232 family) n=1 Tax=Anoxybacteroides voinovskiense TaxID=230470 RepID=A0A840DI71_9BACL|nr:YybS family protein [Anoxybacillus voinovskiensis]MBB4072754.1 uncharacterized protein YybS (DUF2232 family) [Anoxybacillus voinovskiensis]GGJ64894.1 membrane protein [Anoxybacillus voinovskiensis]